MSICHLSLSLSLSQYLGTQSFFVLRACAEEISIIIVTLNTYDTSVLESGPKAWPCECTVHDGDLRHLWTCGWPPEQAGPAMTPRRSNVQWRSACRSQCSTPHTFESGHQGLKIHVTIGVMFPCFKAYSLMYSENPHDHRGNVCMLQGLVLCTVKIHVTTGVMFICFKVYCLVYSV